MMQDLEESIFALCTLVYNQEGLLESNVGMSDKEGTEDCVQCGVDGTGCEWSDCYWDQCDGDDSSL